jgi:hypothetical protein
MEVLSLVMMLRRVDRQLKLNKAVPSKNTQSHCS